MAPKRTGRKLPPGVQNVGSLGLVLLLAGALWTLMLKYPREACGVADVLCAAQRGAVQEAERVPTKPMPLELLADQWPVSKGCPQPYRPVGAHPGCWMQGAATPPCGAAYEALGRCWSPYIVQPARPSAEDPRRPAQPSWR